MSWNDHNYYVLQATPAIYERIALYVLLMQQMMILGSGHYFTGGGLVPDMGTKQMPTFRGLEKACTVIWPLLPWKGLSLLT